MGGWTNNNVTITYPLNFLIDSFANVGLLTGTAGYIWQSDRVAKTSVTFTRTNGGGGWWIAIGK